jgi:hypothetical protein
LSQFIGPSKDIIEKVIQFLDKPHLSLLDGLHGIPKTIRVGRLNEVHDVVDSQNFDIILWNLKIENKHPGIARVAKECFVKINWDFIYEEGQLLWRVRQNEPDICNLNVSPEYIEAPTPHFDNRYDKVLGDHYTGILQRMGQPSLTVPQGRNREIYFLLTIKNHPVGYPIMTISKGSSYGSNNDRAILIQHIHDVPLFVDIDTEYSFGLRFECQGYSEERDHNYSLRIKNYDDVTIREV